MGGDRHSHRLEAHAAEILALIEATPDTTLAEMAAHPERAHGVRAAVSSVWRLLDRHGMSVKKTAHAAEQQRPDVRKRRWAWFERTKPGSTSPRA
ncbi:winged helix-turn-helix domain-containing protein [Rhodospirillum centenum]|nr:winged helix-turn-helix domain-containing protein [Rhodospirillum centenum]